MQTHVQVLISVVHLIRSFVRGYQILYTVIERYHYSRQMLMYLLLFDTKREAPASKPYLKKQVLSKPLRKTCTNCSKLRVHLARRGTQDQAAYRIPEVKTYKEVSVWALWACANKYQSYFRWMEWRCNRIFAFSAHHVCIGAQALGYFVNQVCSKFAVLQLHILTQQNHKTPHKWWVEAKNVWLIDRIMWTKMPKCVTQSSPCAEASKTHLATFILANDPKMCMCVSASTILVRVAFSIVNLVLPCLPESRPMARDKCSPRNVCIHHNVGYLNFRSGAYTMVTDHNAKFERSDGSVMRHTLTFDRCKSVRNLKHLHIN